MSSDVKPASIFLNSIRTSWLRKNTWPRKLFASLKRFEVKINVT